MVGLADCGQGPGAAQTPIRTFYFLILGAAALRAIWFFIPSTLLEPTYTPTPVWAWRTPVSRTQKPKGAHPYSVWRGFHPSPLHEAKHLTNVSLPPCCQGWGWTLLSEILLSSGSLCLFAIFVLIIIFWAYLLKKVERRVTTDTFSAFWKSEGTLSPCSSCGWFQVFKPESSPGVFRPVRKYEPMTSFMAIIGGLAAFQVRS